MAKTVTYTYSTSGIGLMGFIFLVFLVLKLAGIGSVAQWSWWWITAPLWLPTAIYWGFVAALAILAVIGVVCASIFGRWK
jgi:hypothetical protein